MHSKGSTSRLFIGLAFIVWTAFVLSAFYVTQRPQSMQLIKGISATLWAVALMVIMLINAAGLGHWIFKRTQLQSSAQERLLLGTGLGLGVLGFAGYSLGAAGWANTATLAGILLGLMLALCFTKTHHELSEDLKSLASDLRQSQSDAPAWMPFLTAITAVIAFLFTLLPPAEGFDGLMYHLALPERLLADKQIRLYNIFPFWYPSLIEGNFLWALGLGSEQAAQMIHWSFAALVLLLIWAWAWTLFGNKTAWWSLAIVISMPSLPWVASWAYTDMALTFESLACLYAVWRWRDTRESRWLMIGGVFAGLAMGIKYTSFILPVLCAILVFVWERGFAARLRAGLQFSLPALITASPWYLRNWLMMGNPVYPFVFGGLYWDSFRAAWFSENGTGIGWNLDELVSLPLMITLGHRDQNYFDGRIGPFFLLLLPLAVWAIWTTRSAPRVARDAILLLTLFFGLNYLFWTFGVIQTLRLWQSRYLWPGLISFAIPMGLGISRLADLDLPRLRISFITTTMIRLAILVALLDNAVYLVVRTPLIYALGMDSRQAFFERMQPGYAAALELIESTPPHSYIYFLFEPRSYDMARRVQPDPISDNLLHNYYLFKTPEAVLNDWRSKGYTHILVYESGLEFMQMTRPERPFTQRLNQLLEYLEPVAERRDYRLYSIPDG